MANFAAGVSIIIERDLQILLGKRAQNKYAGGIWEFPSGRIEEGESIESTIKREAMEELGVKVDPIQMVNAYIFKRDNVPFILMNYYCKFTGELKKSDEHDELRWVNISDAEALLPFEEQKQTLRQYMKIKSCL